MVEDLPCNAGDVGLIPNQEELNISINDAEIIDYLESFFLSYHVAELKSK